jgi:succinoglycan biosynthesis transport protein ExoP
MEHLSVRQQPGDGSTQLALEPGSLRRMSSAPLSGGYIEVNSADTGSEEWNRWREYLVAVTRHKVAILATGALGAVIAFAVSLFQTPVYGASTSLEVQIQGSQQPFEGISFLNTWDPFALQTQAHLLKSGMVQDRTYVKMQSRRPPANASGSAPQKSVVDSGLVGSVRRWLGMPSRVPDWDGAVAFAMGSLRVNVVKESRIVQIASQSTLPDVAADYVNTLATEYIQQSLDERWSLYQSTSTWLTRAQEDLRAKLEESERQLLEYASASGLVVTGKDEDIAEQKLVQMQAEVSKAQADRIAKESVYRTAMAQPVESLADVLDQGQISQYQVKLTDLRRELADATTSLTPAHPKVKRLEAQIEELESAKSRESGNVLNRMRNEYEAALRRENQLVADLASQSRVLSNQDQKLIRYKMLQREVDTYRRLYDTTLQKGKEASVASALRPVNARVLDAAHAAKIPFTPDLSRNLTYGLFGGFALAVALVLVRERTDASIRAPGSIPVYLNLRELGVIPAAKTDPDLLRIAGRHASASLPPVVPRNSRTTNVPGIRSVEAVELTTWNRKASLLAEAFRGTLTSILASEQNGHPRQVILVTSPSPQEGKSTVIANLAIALAEINQRVLLIDADTRRPRLNAVFNHANTWGLSDLLREKTPCDEYPSEALARNTHVPRLFLLPSGPGSVNVSRLLHSPRMAELIARLRRDFDAILIDSPPVLRVADARILSRLADAVVLVFRAGQTTREAAALAVNVFEADGVPVLGTVLNDWNPHTMGHGYYPTDYRPYFEPASGN